ncbi:hypothetical protein RB653_007305 [Dictyostelium firmibasis]|uniref:IPT/TIG domain-containing protein n=1 Tax=Dictyostelium firmibasis TaxID=79012 RepID=A0AAN7TNJ7_9MYCE
MKIFVIIVFIFYLLTNSNAYTLVSTQNKAAIDLVSITFGVTTTLPCDYLICKPISPNSNDFCVDSIIVPKKSSAIIISNDLTVFNNLTVLSLGENIILKDGFFNNLNQFNFLISVNIFNYSGIISNLIDFPKSLKTINFSYLGSSIPNSIFKSEITSLVVENSFSGYSLNGSMISTNSKLITLGLPISLIENKLPKNLENLKNLKYFSLYIDNGESIKYSLPDFSSLKLTPVQSLVFRFTQSSPSQTWVLPIYLNSITTLNNFEIYLNGFTINSTIGYLDISSLKQNLNLNFENGGINFISSCKQKPCIKVPNNSQLISLNNDFNFNNLDFSKYLNIFIENNNFQQLLPIETIDFENLESLEIIKSKVVGSVPNQYCFIKNLNLQNNQLNSTVPSCYLCVGGKLGDNILPNSFTNFNSNTNPSCPKFSISNQSYNVSSVGQNLTINGNDFGWDLQTLEGPQLVITIPNKEIIVNIPSGAVGTSHSYKTTFYNGTFSFLFNYTYINQEENSVDSKESNEPSFGNNLFLSYLFIASASLFVVLLI